jgi:hypothetical protein
MLYGCGVSELKNGAKTAISNIFMNSWSKVIDVTLFKSLTYEIKSL